ncbi:MAG: ABC transporter permease [Acidobacteriota bacterium]|nr:ABC transporter permease [Acidobacteriota bacterium]
MHALSFWLKRLASLVAVLFALSVITFVIFNVIPGGNPALRMAGRHPTPQLIANISKDWGFNKPIWTQYLDMMDKLLISHNLISYQNQIPVLPAIGRGIPKTASLAIGAAVIWLFFGVFFGVLSGLNQGRWIDRILTVLSMGGISVPIFWLGAILLYLLTFEFHSFVLFRWIPPGGYVNFGTSPLQWGEHLFLPWICLAVTSAGFYTRVVRNSLLQVQSEEYVRTARAMGLSPLRILLRHVLRTSLIPVMSLFALDFGAAIGGTVILIEPVFGINGIGNYAYQALQNLDLPPLMALTLYGGFFIVLMNILADVLFTRLDPRIKVD